MGGKCKPKNLCVSCGKPSYGEMCHPCRFQFRHENRAPDYRGSHRMVVCPGCGGPMHKGCALCWSCHRKSRAALLVPVGVEMTLRPKVEVLIRNYIPPKAPELVTVACHTCGVRFVAVKDWHDTPSYGRGLREDKPDYFYCKAECCSLRPQSG